MQHAGSLYAVCYSKKLDLIFTGGVDNIVASWDPITFENTDFSIKTSSTIVSLTVVNEDHLMIGLFNGDIHIIDLLNRKEIKFITHHKNGIYASLYIPQKNMLVLGSGDGMLSIWDGDNYDLLLSKNLSDAKIRAIANDGEEVYIGTSEGGLYLIDTNELTLKKSYQINNEGINSLCLLPEKNAMIIGGKNAHLNVFSFAKGEVILDIPAHNWAIYKLLLIDDVLYSCSRDKCIKEWDSQSLDLIKRYSYPEYKAHTHSVNNMIYIKEHNYLVSVGDDKSICYWKV